ncbi:DUF4347 domain-containing protein [uncultured Maribacter sp.]|uniref:DUF4347 domain-containing protein n=1 Tax=uncultured Maribacter sp. TaxID=431308 RepID=UPI0030EB9A74
MSIKTNLTFAILIFGLFVTRTHPLLVAADKKSFGTTHTITAESVKENKKSSLVSNNVRLFASGMSNENARTSHLVFIDKSLDDYEVLARSISLPNSKIILLDPKNFEGIVKMTEEIEKHQRLQSIHIVGHAKQAELIIGSDNFLGDDLNMIRKELNSWKSHVSDDADLFLYGCSLAETAQGKSTVNLIASLTGMDATASTNLTGHASLNADWDLEYSTGPIESSIAFSEEVENYAYTLQSLTFADLRNFEEVDEGTAGDGNWTYPDGTGRTAFQSNNTSQPVYLLSAESGYLNEVFKGTITVNSGETDNDDIGFAFGFNGVNDTYIWSWDNAGVNMGVRSGGAHLLYYKNQSSSFTSVPGALIAQGPNNDPWSPGVTYQVEILYTADNIRVKVNGVEKFNVSAADAGVAQFPPGRFGFYNYSQGNVTFGNIQNAPASDEPIPPSAQDDSYGTSPNTTLNVDFISGILRNDYDANLDDFTIVQVSDVSNGSLTLDTNDGSFTYMPTTDYEGVDSFTYKLVQDDNGAESAVRTVTIGVINSNQAPTDIQISNVSISEGATENTNIGTLTTTDANNPDDQHDYSLADNGGGRFTVNGNNLVVANSSLLTPGDYNITVRSTDLFGASTTKVFTITVVNNDKPTSADGQIQMDSGSNYVFSSSDFSFSDTDGDTFGGISIVTAETAGDLEYEGSDVFDGTLISDVSLLNFISPSGSLGDPYASFTFRVVDSRGGISTSSYNMNIEVQDNVNPTAVAQNVVVMLDASGSGSTTAASVDNGSNDAFGIASLQLDKTDFSCSDVATNPNMVTLTVTDNNGNTSTVNAEVTVQDQIDPVAISQDLTVQLDASGNAMIAPADIDNGSTDNCSVATFALDRTDFTCSDIGENTVTLTVTDIAGNSNATTAVVTVEDASPPTLITQDITLNLDENGLLTIAPENIISSSDDNCEVTNTALDRTNFDCADIGQYTITITLTDANGLMTTDTALLTVAGDDNDGDLMADQCDTDDDNDGTPDTDDDFPFDENEDTDTDGDGTGDNEDTDDDDDGTTDADDDFPLDEDEDTDTDGDGTGDNADTDDDNDGTPDTDDDFPLDEDEDTDTDGDGTGDNEDTDDDNDGTPDADDDFPFDENEDTDTDGDGTGDSADTDDDNDGTPDTDDDFPLDEDEDTDTDGDGTGDNEDTDDDNDGTPDADDDFPLDDEEDTDTDGDGTGDNTDTDDDNDGTPDSDDDFPLDEDEDTDFDGDGTGDNADTDDDNDGIPDSEDSEPNNATDTDNDGIPDSEDDDDDNDGVPDNDDAFPLDENENTDTDGDGTGDNTDTDDDNDGTPDSEDDFPLDEDEDTDFDGDGTGDNADTDDDNDGIPDSEDSEPKDSTDTDNDGIPDSEDEDDDNDGTPDADDDFPLDEDENTDTDGDGTGDNSDEDDDNDGTTDDEDDFPLDENEDTDSDSDGTGDNADDDDDNDGVTDIQDDFPTNNEPVLRPAEAFTPNGDGVNDSWMIPGIDNYSNTRVTVYNRYGHEVFSALNYRNDWRGNYSSNSDLLPPGSYLYVIDLGNGSAPIQGWIFINY